MASQSVSTFQLRRSKLAPDDFDPWAPIPFDQLPADLVRASSTRDWPAVLEQLRTLMDGVTTDGPYGRQLLQFVRQLPLGVEPLFDRYRAVTAIDFGDWDDLERCLERRPLEAKELTGIRDIWLAAPAQNDIPAGVAQHQAAWFGIHEYQLNRDIRRQRLLLRRMLGERFTEVTLHRPDVPTNRHLRYRPLQDAVFLSLAESNGGRLPLALELARAGQQLGEENEQLRLVARDLEILIGFAVGSRDATHLEWTRKVASSVGPSPLGAWEMFANLYPLLCATESDEFYWSVRVGERIALKMGSPRAQLQARTWRVAADLVAGAPRTQTYVESLLIEARRAAVGLRVVPLLLDGYSRPRYSAFAGALENARRSGAVWAQISSLAWMTAINPSAWTTRALARLLNVTGWRRPVLVPREIASEAALGLTTAGVRSSGVIELAVWGGRPNISAEVALRHLDESVAVELHEAAIRALGKLGTVRAREILAAKAGERNALAELARKALNRSPATITLSGRELEVLRFAARGLTNRDIGVTLGLSEHTIARHIANARSKLGAANRAEAVSRLAELSKR